MQRIGIFAGTFDPVHKGHIGFCLAAAKTCQLDVVYLLPEPQPRDKHDVTPLQTRIVTIKNAIQTDPLLRVMQPKDDQFTIDNTLHKIQQQFSDSQLYLLVGSDIACHSLERWNNLDRLLASTKLIVGLRTGYSNGDVSKTMQHIMSQQGAFDYTILPSPYADESSSKIRLRR